jgi:hypothetical protein
MSAAGQRRVPVGGWIAGACGSVLAILLLVGPASGGDARPTARAPALRRLAQLTELILLVAPRCPACETQEQLVRRVADWTGWPVRVVSTAELQTTAGVDPSLQLIAVQRAEWATKLPVLYVAVPQLPALIPVVSAWWLPQTEWELVERLQLIADLAAGGR